MTSKIIKTTSTNITSTTTNSNYVNKLIETFKKEKNLKISVGQERYMKSQFPFIGIKSPKRVELLKSFINENGREYTDDDILIIYKQPEREFKYIAIELIAWKIKSKKIGGEPIESRIELFENMMKIEPFWDTIDIIASKLIGTQFKLFPSQIEEYTNKWINSSSFWDRRVCLLFQLTYKKDQVDIKLLFSFINKTINEKEFFIRKAIGWSLRQLSKIHHNKVFDFIEQNKSKLSQLSIREGSKYLSKEKIK